MSEPRKAPPETRLIILDALSDPKRRFLDGDGPTRRWLDHWNLTEAGFFHELCEDLRIHEIFLKPKNKPSDPQKYHTRLIYEADPPDYPQELNIHITLSPKAILPGSRSPFTPAIPPVNFPRQR